MLSSSDWLVIFLVCLPGANASSSNDIESLFEESARTVCSSISFQSNYSNCCKYPRFSAYMYQLIPCNEECISSTDKSCCVGKCCYVDKMGILNVTENGDGSEAKVEMNLEALVKVFLLSVNGDIKWEPVVRNSIKQCYDRFWGTFDGYNCGFIPNSFFPIISCSYIENFLNCPVWNPNGLPDCGIIFNFVEKCFN